MTLALFDFDGTITKSDSFIKFIRFVVGDFRFVFGLVILSPILLAYFLKFIPNYKSKELVFSYFFKGMASDVFLDVAKEYSLVNIDKIVRFKAWDRISWHKAQGHNVVIVSASIDCWIHPWSTKNDLGLIATKVEFINGIVTGRFSTKNCFGIEKVNRLTEVYDLNAYDYIYAYGDSLGDKEMLSIANESFYKFLD